ncbi:phosphopantetheine adenylyltransferase [Methylocystis bryophila]|nr:phosphopantetheine adenylyltransferase [Methylocystis bryophila]
MSDPDDLAETAEIAYGRAMTSPTRVALYPGSFDPLTFGHLDVIRKGAALFDKIIVAVGAHPGKTPMLSLEQRIALILEACAMLSLPKPCEFEARAFEGLAVEAARGLGASTILRGLRDGADFDYEMSMAGMNTALAPEIGTLFVPSSPEARHINATLVRQIAKLGGDLSAFAPEASVAALKRAAGRS